MGLGTPVPISAGEGGRREPRRGRHSRRSSSPSRPRRFHRRWNLHMCLQSIRCLPPGPRAPRSPRCGPVADIPVIRGTTSGYSGDRPLPGIHAPAPPSPRAPSSHLPGTTVDRGAGKVLQLPVGSDQRSEPGAVLVSVVTVGARGMLRKVAGARRDLGDEEGANPDTAAHQRQVRWRVALGVVVLSVVVVAFVRARLEPSGSSGSDEATIVDVLGSLRSDGLVFGGPKLRWPAMSTRSTNPR